VSRHRFHGDEARFGVVADFVADSFGQSVKYIADVAGGQGMLARLLRKRFNYEVEVIDPRGWSLKGVPVRPEEFSPDLASFYDLVIGLHPDQALPAVVAAATIRPTVIVPCCNFFDRTQRLGRADLLAAIERHLAEVQVKTVRHALAFDSPFNIALVTEPN
jgi:hypothetical protein